VREHRSVETEYYEPFLGQHLASLADPSFDDDGNFQFAVHIIRDISERKRAEELSRMNAELKGYAHVVSHDLKGPISSAAVAFDILMSDIEEGGVPEGKAEKLKEVIVIGRSNMSNANDLVESLLFLAETGEPKDVFPVSIEDTINEVLADNSEGIEEKVITVELGPALGKVVASPTQMYQLFSNLVRNSIEHNKSENPVIEISSPGVEGTVHRFLVRDNGQGIPEEILDEVFTPFVRAQSGGKGIGLSIVEKVVKTYGGEIRAHNDNGACFEFTLEDYEK
jgi:signal transduction histidine kinase